MIADNSDRLIGYKLLRSIFGRIFFKILPERNMIQDIPMTAIFPEAPHFYRTINMHVNNGIKAYNVTIDGTLKTKFKPPDPVWFTFN